MSDGWRGSARERSGFTQVSVSPRGESPLHRSSSRAGTRRWSTRYLSPILRRYVDQVGGESHAACVRLQFMQSQRRA
jgi:N-methylhydantoinase A/oxoprolinase/acetone carboxylase beta subunit